MLAKTTEAVGVIKNGCKNNRNAKRSEVQKANTKKRNYKKNECKKGEKFGALK